MVTTGIVILCLLSFYAGYRWALYRVNYWYERHVANIT
jgi:hypothetical protein